MENRCAHPVMTSRPVPIDLVSAPKQSPHEVRRIHDARWYTCERCGASFYEEATLSLPGVVVTKVQHTLDPCDD